MANDGGNFDFRNGISGVLPPRQQRETQPLPGKATPLPPCRYRKPPEGPLTTPRAEDRLLALLEPEISDPFSLAPANYQALLSESQSLFDALAQDGDRAWRAAAELLGEELFLLGIVASQKG